MHKKTDSLTSTVGESVFHLSTIRTLSLQQTDFQVQFKIIYPIFTFQVTILVFFRRTFFQAAVLEKEIGKCLAESTLIAQHFPVTRHEKEPCNSRDCTVVQF